MARIDSIWVHSGDFPDKELTIHVSLKPSGTAQVKVALPQSLKEALMDICQKAADEHEAITSKIDNLKKEVRESYNQTKAIIYSCNTTRQLKDVWPECAKYIEVYEPVEQRTTAIAPITDERMICQI